MTTATHARFADYDRGLPDPSTATCARHAIGAPTNEATKATNSAKPLAAGDLGQVECTVCGTENADLIGLLVHDWSGDADCVYAGPGREYERRGGAQTTHDLRFGTTTQIRCNPQDVAPATVSVPVKDPRVVVVKRSKEEIPHVPYVTKAGKYELSLPAEEPSYFDKKGDAVRVGHIRLAIIDWHASRAAKIGA